MCYSDFLLESDSYKPVLHNLQKVTSLRMYRFEKKNIKSPSNYYSPIASALNRELGAIAEYRS